jgi:hypothetical protein
MAKRGKVLRDPLAGPGLLMAEGRQYQFILDGIWKSEMPAKPGLLVDLEFDAQGKISGITPVPDSQLAREQAERASVADKKASSRAAAGLVGPLGALHLVVVALLILSWFFLTAISVELPLTGTLELTFWQLLRYLGSGNLLEAVQDQVSVSGSYVLLAVIAIAGPILQQFWKDRRAAVGGLLPLSFLFMVGALLRSNVGSLLANGVGGPHRQLDTQAAAEFIKATSFGLGTYVSIVIGVYFAFLSVKQFRHAKRGETTGIEQSRRAAA